MSLSEIFVRVGVVGLAGAGIVVALASAVFLAMFGRLLLTTVLERLRSEPDNSEPGAGFARVFGIVHGTMAGCGCVLAAGGSLYFAWMILSELVTAARNLL